MELNFISLPFTPEQGQVICILSVKGQKQEGVSSYPSVSK